MPKFGVRLPVAGPLASVEAVSSTAMRAEDSGYDSVWVHDFISWTKSMDRSHVSCGAIDLLKDDTTPQMYETITVLAYLAAVTSRINIGSAILCTPYRNPVVQAKQIAMIDVLSGGRLILGAGVGALRRIGLDFEVVNVPRAQKYERTAEYLRLMREVWESANPKFDGEFVTLPETEINPKPIQTPLPIWLGGKGEKSLSICGELGNGWIPTWLTPADYRAEVPKVLAQVASHGRSTDGFVIAKECYAAIDTDDARAREFSGPTFQTFRHGFTVATDDGATASALLGDPARIRDQVHEYLDAGVQHFEMKFIYLSVEHLHRQMDLFAEQVIAKL